VLLKEKNNKKFAGGEAKLFFHLRARHIKMLHFARSALRNFRPRNFEYSVEQYADAEEAYSLPKKISPIFGQVDF
jgi:hypothetical protein